MNSNTDIEYSFEGLGAAVIIFLILFLFFYGIISLIYDIISLCSSRFISALLFIFIIVLFLILFLI